VKNFLNFGLAETFAKGGNLLLYFLITTVVPLDVYGVIAIFISIELILLEATLVGTHNYILRNFSNLTVSKKNVLMNKILKINFVAFVLLQAFIILTSFLQFPLPENILINELQIFFVALYFSTFLQQTLCRLRAEGNVEKYVVIRVMAQILKIVIILISVTKVPTTFAFCTSYLVANIIVVMLLSINHKLQLSDTMYLTKLSNYNAYKNILVYSFPLCLHAVIGSTYSVFDRILVSNSFEIREFAIYSYAGMFGFAPFFIVSVIAITFMRDFFLYDYDNPKTKNALNSFLLYSVITTSIIGVLVYFLIFPAVTQYTNPQYINGRSYLSFILFMPILQCLINFSTYRLMSQQRVRMLPIITGFCLMLYFIASVILIPSYGIWGVIYSMIIVECLMCIIFYLYSEWV